MPEERELPPQHQDRQPGIEAEMEPRPRAEDPHYRGSGKLEGRVALITGGDSGIGRAVAIAFAAEGADVAVDNAAEQHEQRKLEDISAEPLERTFRTNIFSQFFITKAALRHLEEGSTVINTTSVTAYRGSSHLLDYASTKGAIDEEKVKSFGKDVPLGRPGQPEEVAPCFVFLASDDSSYRTGQVLHPNGGEVVNG